MLEQETESKANFARTLEPIGLVEDALLAIRPGRIVDESKHRIPDATIKYLVDGVNLTGRRAAGSADCTAVRAEVGSRNVIWAKRCRPL